MSDTTTEIKIDAKRVAELRAITGAGMVDCQKALKEAEGDLAKAAEILRKKGIAKAGTKGDRETKEGMVASYIHNDRVGVLVEIQCETDFVARTEQFQAFVKDIAMHIAAANPLYLNREAVAAEVIEKEKEIAGAEFEGSNKPANIIAQILEGRINKYYGENCLLEQRFIKDEDKTIEEVTKEMISKTGENIQIKRFSRFALGA
jgi:elongation factor Ts